MNTLLTRFFVFAFVVNATGQQLPDCSENGIHSLYVLTMNNSIYRVDNLNSIPSNPVKIDSIPFADAQGLTISNNLNGGEVSPTFYSTFQNQFIYKGTNGWINTGQTTSVNAGNIGGGVNFIFNHKGTSGSIYRYDGNGSATNIVLFTSPNSVYDIAADSLDNFYVLLLDANQMIKFNSSGTPLDTLAVSGLPSLPIQPGLAMINSSFYVALQFPTSNTILKGSIIGNNVAFTPLTILNLDSQIQDIATCPYFNSPAGMEEQNESSSLIVFPNPSTTELSIVFANPIDQRVEFSLIDSKGAAIKQFNEYVYDSHTMDISALNKGVYILCLQSDRMTNQYFRIVIN